MHAEPTPRAMRSIWRAPLNAVAALDRFLGWLCLAPIKFWQRLISPFLGEHCRFFPTCSAYAAEAFRRHGFAKGMWLTAARIARCNPWCKGGEDPCP